MQTQAQGRVKPSSIVYWLRVFLAICAGFANQFLRISEATFGDLAFYVAVALAIIFYVMSVIIVRYVLRYGEAELKGKNKDITLGGGTFIVLWAMVAVLLYTVM
jgi:membrane protein YdbS with pleckstrin-like domain